MPSREIKLREYSTDLLIVFNVLTMVGISWSRNILHSSPRDALE